MKEMELPDNIKVDLSQDTAFYLTKQYLIEKGYSVSDKGYSLICSRGDPEKTRQITVESKLKSLVEDPQYRKTFDEWFKVIAESHEVHSDRLHTAILAAMLGKPTYLYANAHNKNLGVYEYSLKEYSNLQFIA